MTQRAEDLAADSPVREDRPDRARLVGSLGVSSIVFMVVAAAAPLTVVGGGVPLGILIGNGVGFPTMYAAAAVLLVLFAVGFAMMARHVPRPGAFYTFIRYGLGERSGLAAAYVAVVAYTMSQVAVFGYIGYILGNAVAAVGRPDIPWWLFALASIAVVGILGYRDIDLSSKVLAVVLIAEVAVVLVIVGAVTVSGGAEGLSLAPFAPANVLSGSPGVGLMFGVAAFIGFESTAVYRDEARDPHRTIPRATYLSVILVGVFYVIASWGMIMAWGPSKIMDVVAEDPGSTILVTAAKYFGAAGATITNVLLVSSMFACVLSFHNVISRYQHSMAMSGTLPRRLAHVHARHRSPHVSSLVQTSTAAVLVVLFAVLGLDPVRQVFGWFSSGAVLPVVLIMAATSVAVIVYSRRERVSESMWSRIVAPGLAFVGLIGAAVLIIANFPTLVGDVDGKGVPAFGIVSAILLGAMVISAIMGWVQATVKLSRSRRAT
ncbi:APC family permease [Microbacterium sp. SA39]|uniref:APC family permease n=1 Tax=Microbacterium sp. SA39 TaxID=1263625 RepID=UPI001269C237|nr:APC family permease [Microbacterium sp. SA39]